jgi:ATP-dependent DNA helicase UvrD/PcrA
VAIQISPAVAPVISSSRSIDANAPVPFHVAAGLLRGLNREQRAAVKHGDGPLLVVAGPGTGKTEVVTRRVAWLIATKRARAREILALTFTDNAAQEMQARVDLLVPYGQADAAVHTFHAFGDRLLREYAFELGLPGDIRLINRAEAIVLLREHVFELGLETYRPLGDPTRFLGALVDFFQRAKDQDVSPDALSDYAERLPETDDTEAGVAQGRRELARAFLAYQSLLARNGLIDHGDQVSLALRLLRERPGLRDEVTARYRYLLVDEFQDMNPAQVELVHLLTGQARNVTIVGDPDQAIYNFRGAAADNMTSLAQHYPDLRHVVLRRNYRSRQAIVDAAHRLVSHSDAGRAAREPQVSNRRSRGSEPVRSSWYATPDDEADGVAGAVAAAIAGGARPRDVAVLARSNAEVEPLARALRMRGVAVRTQSQSDFFAQAEVRPLLAYLRVVVDPHHTLELYTLATSFPYQLGGEHLTDLLSGARRRHQSLWQVLSGADNQAELPTEFAAAVARLVSDVRAGIALAPERTSTEVLYDYVRRSGRLAQLASSADPSGPRAVARFFEIVRSRGRFVTQDRVAFVVPYLDTLIEADEEPADTGPLDVDAVSVLTVHRAKGLEFKIVHLTGLVDGRFPARGRPPTLDVPWDEIAGRTGSEMDRLDEERRLCFVAMTRARDELWLSYHVTGPGGRMRRRPSVFISEALDAPSAASSVELDAITRIEALGQPETNVAEPSAATVSRGAFSFSELETYLDCPERYRFRHVVGLPASPHHALTYGSAMHQAVAAFHLSRGKRAPLSEDQLLEVFARAWSPEGFLSREHEERRYAAGQAALRAFRDEQLAKPSQVAAVERPFAFQIDELTVRGRIDRLDATPDGAVIIDYKSSDVRDQAKADQKARDSLQLQVYSLAHQSEHGSLPHEVRLHFLDSGVVGRARPDPARLEKARAKLKSAAAKIGDGEFPAHPSAIACGYCPYRQICSASAA